MTRGDLSLREPLRDEWPMKNMGKRECPRCGQEAPVFFAVFSDTLTFKNHLDASHIDYCRNSRSAVEPRESR